MQMTAIFGRNARLGVGLVCAWVMTLATAQAQVDAQSKKTGGGEGKSTAKTNQAGAKDDEAKGMAGMGGMGGMSGMT